MGLPYCKVRRVLFWGGTFAFLSISIWENQSSIGLCLFLDHTIFTMGHLGQVAYFL